MKIFKKWLLRNTEDPSELEPVEPEDDEERRFEHDFRESLVALERELHHAEDEEHIMQEAIISACKFYQADWCGIMIGDPQTGVWTSTFWYTEGKGWMAPASFREFEYFENFPRWVEGLKEQKPVIAADCDALKDSHPEEYQHYYRLHAHTVMGVPFGIHPTGFLVLRNAGRYPPPCTPDRWRRRTDDLSTGHPLSGAPDRQL